MEIKLPMYCGSNLHLNGSKPWKHEKGSIVRNEGNCNPVIIQDGDEFFLEIDVDDSFMEAKPVAVDTDMLGEAFEPEMKWENPDGSPLAIDTDYNDEKRDSVSPVGPFKELKAGKNRIKIW